MVARIIKGKDIAGLLRYNEKEKSTVLYSQYINDVKEAGALSLKDKVEVLQAYIRLNPAAAKPTFHVSLNPHPQDKLSDKTLEALGREYMAGMNYGEQPYLIYKHEDLERVHIHIVSVNIGLDGKVINSSLERYRSERVRKYLEAKFHLRKAGEETAAGSAAGLADRVEALAYGKTDTQRALGRVVRFAAQAYAFASLQDFRALLQYYQVSVEEVKDPLYPDRTVGLLYAILGAKGEKVSIRLKASSLGLEAGYEAISTACEQGAKEIAARNLGASLGLKIVETLASCPGTDPMQYKNALKEAGIIVLRRPAAGHPEASLFFLDTRARAVLPFEALVPYCGGLELPGLLS